MSERVQERQQVLKRQLRMNCEHLKKNPQSVSPWYNDSAVVVFDQKVLERARTTVDEKLSARELQQQLREGTSVKLMQCQGDYYLFVACRDGVIYMAQESQFVVKGVGYIGERSKTANVTGQAGATTLTV